MNALNRLLGVLMALVWVAALVGALFLVWGDQAYSLNTRYGDSDLILSLTESQQIIATLIIAALMLPGVLLLFGELMPRRSRAVEYDRAREVRRGEVPDRRISALESRVEDLQRRVETPASSYAARPERAGDERPMTPPERHRERRPSFLDRMRMRRSS